MNSESSGYDKLENMLQGGSSELHNVPLKYLRIITNNFSNELLLGEGGFGTVYKGVLQNGKIIAVKKLKLSIPGVRQFENEASHLMRLKHPNVVLLVGWCSETQYIPMEYNGTYVCAEKPERLICLEYMPKGNLRGFLSDESSGLCWDTRYKIIQGICYGLRYLHEEWQVNSPIVHMDLKPANILLDNNMVPKIADFGLSRLFSEEKTWTCTISRDGTLGYMSPEYINRGLVSTKSDIFSLGVIIIEIVTGHRDYPDETGTSSKEFIEKVLYNWIRVNWLESLVGNAQLEVDCQQIRRCSQITRLLQIALDCVKIDRCERPTISQIIRRLDGLGSDFIISNIKEASNIASRRLHRPQAKLGPFERTLLPCQELQSERRYKTPGFCRAVTFIALHQSEKKTTLRRITMARAAPPPPGMVTMARDACFLWELRKYVLLQATLAASVTYSAMLSPPGGVWPDNDSSSTGGRLAGDPVLQVTYASRYGAFFYFNASRYEAFFYFNATAFVASMVTISLLLVHTLSRHRGWLRALQAAMILNQLSLMGAYAAGSCRDLAMSAYVVALVALVSSYVCAHVLLFALCALRRRNANDSTDDVPQEEPGIVERSRKYLLIFATPVAAVTYKAGLSTPGGFLSDSQDNDHLAGDPMLRGHHPDRFMGFFYFNTTAFVASLVVIMLLMSRTVTRHRFRSCALWVCTGAALIGLTGAFAVGSCRSVKTSIYIVALVVAVLSYIGLQVLVFFCEPVANWVHSIQDTMQRYLRPDQIELQDPRVHAVHNPQETAEADQLLQKSRMYLLLLAILAASVSYQAGLNPPGGFWQAKAADGVHHYLAGDPVLHNTYPQRYLVFFYCNATAFVASLVILILLLSSRFNTQGIKYCALQVSMIMVLLGLLGAYAAGSCRQVSKSVYVSVLVIPVFLYVGIHVMVFMLEVYPNIATWRKTVWDKLEESVPRWLKNLFELTVEEDEEVKWKLEKRRKLLLLLAILAASLTYQAGLSPPGGFWQENKTGHVVGNPVLNDNYRLRYIAFFYCNATAFVASLATIMLLVNRKLSARGIQSHALRVCVILVLVGLMGAFTAGSSRKISIYVIILVFAVLVCIALQVVLDVSESVQGLLQRLLSFFDITEGEVGFILPHRAANNGGPRDLWYEKLPKYLLLLAGLAAAVTYEAAMNPPGGLWNDGQTGHVPGDPVLWSSHPNRYKAFLYCNATAFMASLVIIVLLLIKRVCRVKQAILALHAAMILNLFGLMGAYAAGSSWRLRTSAYILALVIGVSVYIVVLIIVSIRNWRRRSHLHRAELGSGLELVVNIVPHVPRKRLSFLFTIF